jgi:transmembrane sensor
VRQQTNVCMQQQPEEQIRDLLTRYVKGECTDDEVAFLERWYDRLTREKETVRLLSAAEEERLVAKLWNAIAAKEGKYPAIDDGHRRRRKMLRYAAVWAGMLVMSGGILLQWNRRWQKGAQRKPLDFTVISTGYQQVRKVLLPDSSIVWLNSATHLSYHPDFSRNREVRLSGEAFFQVAQDVAHPFVVRAGKTSTRVFGTAFNVSAYPEAGQLRVSLQSGKIGVEYDGHEGKAEKILTPGQLLIYDKELGSGQVMQQAPGEMDVWTAGRLLFYETPLKEALAQVEARYGVHIVYDRPLKNQTITARFENTALEKVLEHLSFGWDLHFMRTKDTLHVRQGSGAKW